jgi:hypothetical protein
LARRRRSRESDAGSGKRRLIFCPSPFAAARLPFAPPSSLPSFCARSVCPPHPFPLPFAFVAVFLSFPLLPRVGFAFSRPSLCWTGFPCGHSRGKPCPPGLFSLAQPGLAVSDPGASRCSIGLPDWPRGIRTAPGDGSRRDPGSESGATASRTNGSVSSSVNSSVRSGRTGRGAEGEGRAGAPGLLRAAPNPSLLGEQYC